MPSKPPRIPRTGYRYHVGRGIVRKSLALVVRGSPHHTVSEQEFIQFSQQMLTTHGAEKTIEILMELFS